jgi:hypothetical protein
MKRTAILLVLFIFGFAFLAAAQHPDLGELAKKEKARREALEKAGKKVKVLTNEDVGKIKSQLGMVSGNAEPQEGEPVATEDSSYAPPVEGEDYVPDQQPEQPPVDPNAEHQKHIDQLENQKDEAQKTADDARANVGAGGLYHSRNTGDQYKKAAEAEKKVEHLEDQIDKANANQEQQQQPAQAQPAPPQDEYVPPADDTSEQPPADEPPSDEQPPQI